MINNLLIIGAGGHGRVVKETAMALNKFGEIDFLDDKADAAIGKCEDYKLFKNKYRFAFIAFGNNNLRAKWHKLLIEEGFILPTLIHPTTFISPSAKVLEGTIISANATVNTNSVIEKGCIISIGALVDHDSIVGEFSHINLGAIVKSGCKVKGFIDLDAGTVYTA